MLSGIGRVSEAGDGFSSQWRMLICYRLLNIVPMLVVKKSNDLPLLATSRTVFRTKVKNANCSHIRPYFLHDGAATAIATLELLHVDPI